LYIWLSDSCAGVLLPIIDTSVSPNYFFGMAQSATTDEFIIEPDLRVEVDGVVFPAHQLVLCSCSGKYSCNRYSADSV
jgi:hypothetical protein